MIVCAMTITIVANACYNRMPYVGRDGKHKLCIVACLQAVTFCADLEILHTVPDSLNFRLTHAQQLVHAEHSVCMLCLQNWSVFSSALLSQLVIAMYRM